MDVRSTYLSMPEVASDDLLPDLVPLVLEPTGRSSSGYPYLSRAAWFRLRDWVPHVLADGGRVLARADWLEARLGGAVADAVQVVRQVVRTAAITAPSDLWLLRYVLSALVTTGWAARLADGVEVPPALEPDLTLLLARGYVVRSGSGYRWAPEPSARRVWTELAPLPPDRPTDLSRRWAAALRGDPADVALLDAVASPPIPSAVHPPPAWVATPEDVELGYRLVPIVLGLRASGRIAGIREAGRVDVASLGPLDPRLVAPIAATLLAAGWIAADGAITPIGDRGLSRGPGPFGIIEAYHPYLAVLPQIWTAGSGTGVHVERATNVAASQDANRATFTLANDALDRFCADTGFRYRVFVEHAVGKGEAIRQRYARSGDTLVYVGADLEEAAIAAARTEVVAGRLPASVSFVQADIGRPDVLVAELRRRGIAPDGAVMLVGNGFHEVRDRSDTRMVEVFRGYQEAGIVLLFTEESALSVDDLLETAWNTYHAGFRYVHERSGQGLRPAGPSPTPGIGPPLPASWVECATRAGYVRFEKYGSRSRTIHPYPTANGHNPSVSANQFFVPARLAATLPVQ